MKRIILSGANGAMGHEIAACINNRDDCKIVAGLDINTNVYSDFPIYNNADELTAMLASARLLSCEFVEKDGSDGR